jgi:hypothetical protein
VIIRAAQYVGYNREIRLIKKPDTDETLSKLSVITKPLTIKKTSTPIAPVEKNCGMSKVNP